MKFNLYCIYDLKAEGVVNGVFQAFSTDAMAARFFEGVIKQPGSMIHEHPSDFELRRVGVVDYDTLKVECNPQACVNAVSSGRDVARAIERVRGQDVPQDGDQLALTP